ncbi:MAG: penicillin-binding protein activator [Firmicutes bacterium]|nr:penicillin-binding protein activator [Bacillota bacterium]
MKKGNGALIIILILLIVAAVLSIFVFKLFEKKPVTIGAILPFTGTAANSGQNVRDGLNLALEEVNSQGGIGGRKIELIFQDSKTDPEAAKRVFEEMEKNNRPDLYLSILSPIVIALSTLAEKNQVPLISPLVTGSNQAIIEGKKWTFRTCAPADVEVSTMITILNQKGIKKAGIIYQNDPMGQTIKEPFQSAFTRQGGTVSAESYEPNTTDFKPQISKLSSMEAIYLAGLPVYLGQIIKQLRETKYQGLITAVSAAAHPSINNLPEANGVYIAAQLCYNPDFSIANKVKEKYESKYNKPFDHEAGYGYDLIRLLAGLLENKEISRAGIRDVLEGGFTYSGIFGNLNIQKGSHDLSPLLYPAQIINGELRFE